MASETDVANLALIKIGTEARVVALDTDDRFAAATLKAVWATERQAAIRDGAWNFAGRRAALAAAVLDPGETIYPWAYKYPLPSGSLRLIEVLDTPRADYQDEGHAVLCNSAGPVYVRYSIDVPEPAQWDASFAEAFACRLAWRCGKRIAGSAFSTDDAWDDYKEALSSAKRVDARENPPIPHEESSWVTARFGWGGGPYGYDPARWG